MADQIPEAIRAAGARVHRFANRDLRDHCRAHYDQMASIAFSLLAGNGGDWRARLVRSFATPGDDR